MIGFWSKKPGSVSESPKGPAPVPCGRVTVQEADRCGEQHPGTFPPPMPLSLYNGRGITEAPADIRQRKEHECIRAAAASAQAGSSDYDAINPWKYYGRGPGFFDDPHFMATLLVWSGATVLLGIAWLFRYVTHDPYLNPESGTTVQLFLLCLAGFVLIRCYAVRRRIMHG